MLKLTFQAIPHCLLHICNMSLMSGVFPNSWKCAYVTPLDKGGLRKDVSNLRPVSLLPLPGKLLEKIVHQQTYSYLDQNNILTDCQGGFRPNHSTVSTVAEHDITKLTPGRRHCNYTTILVSNQVRHLVL